MNREELYYQIATLEQENKALKQEIYKLKECYYKPDSLINEIREKMNYWYNCYESTKKFIQDKIENCNDLLNNYQDIDKEENKTLFDFTEARLNAFEEIRDEFKKIEKQ